MKKKLGIIGVLAAVVMFTGCSSAEVAPTVSADDLDDTVAERGSQFPGQKWDHCLMNVFLGSYGASSFRGFERSSPHYYIELG